MTSEARGRSIVYQRSHGRCEVCGRPAETFHHRLKRSHGGTWSPANGLHLCGDGTRYCHGWVEAHPAHALALGLWVPSGVDPATRPAYIRPVMFARGWWLLDDDGMLHFPAALPTAEPFAAAVQALTAARLLPDESSRFPYSPGYA